MAKRIPDARLDAQLAVIAGSKIHFCSGEPADYAGIAAVQLATQNIAGAITYANGDVDGRKMTTPAQLSVPIAATGICNHVAVSNGVDTLLRVTTCPSMALTSGGSVNSAASNHTLRDVV